MDLFLSLVVGMFIGGVASTISCYIVFKRAIEYYSWNKKFGIGHLILINSVSISLSYIFLVYIGNIPEGRALLGTVLQDSEGKWLIILMILGIFFSIHSIVLGCSYENYSFISKQGVSSLFQ